MITQSRSTCARTLPACRHDHKRFRSPSGTLFGKNPGVLQHRRPFYPVVPVPPPSSPFLLDNYPPSWSAQLVLAANMLAQRSLRADWHRDHHTLAPCSTLDFTNTNDCFWPGRKMNESFPQTSPLSPAPCAFSLSSTTNMTRTEERSKASLNLSPIKPQEGFSPPPSDYDRVFRKFHKHTASDSTNTTASNDSSPTTTISTVEDSSASETSPGSSPESPPPTTFTSMLRPRTADGGPERYFELQKEPPPRKQRNMKNLEVNTSRQPGKAASTTLLTIQPKGGNNAVISPFLRPPTPKKRKPNNLGLTIMTPANALNAPHEIRLKIPPTPAFARPGLLRHFQSSPSLPLVSGLSLQDSHSDFTSHAPALATILSPTHVKESPAIEEADEEQNFDIPLSREEKPEAYPNGPICVYEPYIDLYLEPTAEQARQYDVVLNVANEVRNPLITHHEPTPVEPDLRLDGGGGIQYAPKRDRSRPGDAEPRADSRRGGSPTTPKATPLDSTSMSATHSASTQKDPEYIHIPWDHNSDIVPDLLRLCKVIDDKIAQGNRVLVHCQCGVSRSASLVVAYGLYKNPDMSVQEAYDAVKKRSKWIGPNMNLIMQLQEFRTSLAHGGVLPGNRAFSPLTPSSALSEWNGPFSQGKKAHEIPMSAVIAPTTNAATMDNLPPITPGPSSAPSGFSWPAGGRTTNQRPRAVSAVKPATTYVDPSGHVLPALSVVGTDQKLARVQTTTARLEGSARPIGEDEPQLSSPRSAHFAMTPLQPSVNVDSADTFGIMSPTATEFNAARFDRSALLASLGMGFMHADEETPRRSLSLRSRPRPSKQEPNALGINAEPTRRLRTKISSPSLREQQQLQSLQAKIEASLSHRHPPASTLNTVDEALMSPRATEFTSNPFALPTPKLPPETPDVAAKAPPDALLHEPQGDPRSPVQKGASPIIRSIWDVL